MGHRSHIITEMINGITEIKQTSKRWKLIKLILLLKSGKDLKLLNTYRPISILPALSKVWEKCLKLLMERCTSMDQFHRKQYGFRWERNTANATTRVTNIADDYKKKGRIYVLVTLDITYAFNTLS